MGLPDYLAKFKEHCEHLLVPLLGALLLVVLSLERLLLALLRLKVRLAKEVLKSERELRTLREVGSKTGKDSTKGKSGKSHTESEKRKSPQGEKGECDIQRTDNLT